MNQSEVTKLQKVRVALDALITRAAWMEERFVIEIGTGRKIAEIEPDENMSTEINAACIELVRLGALIEEGAGQSATAGSEVSA